LANWLFSVAQHDDLFTPEVKTVLPELTSAAPYLCSRAALLDIFETMCWGRFWQNARP